MLVTVRSLNSPKSNKLIVLEEVSTYTYMWNLRGLHHANMTKVNCNVHSMGHLYLQQGLNQWFWIKLRFQRQSCYRTYQECLNYYCQILFSPSMRSNQGLAVFMHRCKIGFIYGGIFETTMNTRMTFAFSFIVSNFYPIFTILTNLYPTSFLYFLNRYKKKTKLDFRFFHGVNYLIEHIQSVYQEKSKTCTLLGQLRR